MSRRLVHVNRQQLHNGLRVWSVPRPQSGTVALMAHFPIGSRSESEVNNGISHFLEHMVFTGTEKWDEAEITDLVRRHGGDYNAQTSREETIYYLYLPATAFDFGMEWLHQLLFRPTFLPEKFEKERQVIINEKGGELDRFRCIWEWVEDHNLGWSIPRAVRQRLYPDSTLLMPIIGTDHSLKNITREMLVEYYQRFYVPENMTLIVAGDIEQSRIIETAENIFRNEPAHPSPPHYPPTTIQPDAFHVHIKGPAPNDQGQLLIGALLDSSRHQDSFAWWVIAEMLENVYMRDIRYAPGLAYGVSVFPVLYVDTGYLCIHTSADVEDFPAIRDVIEKHIQRLIRGDFLESELQEAQISLTGRATLSVQDNLECAWWICNDILSISDESQPYPDYNENIMALSPADIQRVAARYLAPEKLLSVEHHPFLTPRHLKPLMIMGAVGAGVSVFLKSRAKFHER